MAASSDSIGFDWSITKDELEDMLGHHMNDDVWCEVKRRWETKTNKFLNQTCDSLFECAQEVIREIQDKEGIPTDEQPVRASVFTELLRIAD